MPASVNLSDIELVKWRSTVHAPARMNAAFEVKHGEDQRGARKYVLEWKNTNWYWNEEIEENN